MIFDWGRDMIEYNKKNIPLAKSLRKNMTPWERKLWYQYLSKYPIRFQRQKVIGNYIIDFYCAKARLAIELDGGGHYDPEQAAADHLRTKELESIGLRVIRICNMDIDKNFRGVCEFLDAEVQNSLPQSASLTAPSSEGAMSCASVKTIFALGFFDGVHLGHQVLLKACSHLANRMGCHVGAVTFASHPDALVASKSPKLLNTVEERQRFLFGNGVFDIQVLPFDEDLRNMPWQDFLEMLLERGAAGFVCGDDFRFGYRGEGNAQKLADFCRERGLCWAIVPEQTLDGVRISSTHIRGLIETGDMETAAKFLGHHHSLSGFVVSGRQLGRTIGVPTANILIPEGIVVPKLGVYATECLVDGILYKAVTNIGSRPTVDGHQVRGESWLLDFEGDLYGKHMTVFFRKFLRPEHKFASLEDLKAQIREDAAEAHKCLR